MDTEVLDRAEVATEKKLVWVNILWFGITTLLAVIGLPLYIYYYNFSVSAWVIFGVWSVGTMMAITLGYHRLFAHRAFKSNRLLVFLNLLFGAAAFKGSALEWASQHRDHHRYTDTPRDPYNIKQGFWYAHMGWFLFHKHEKNLENVTDLSADPMVTNQHRYWGIWAWGAGVVLPLVIGLLCGDFWGVFFLAGVARFVVISQSVFLINSACHYFGKPNYDVNSSAKDSWVCALLTHGEGYHSYHHRFPSDYRNGVKWHHWDPTKWMVKAFSWIGWTWDLKVMPKKSIDEARQKARMALSV